MARYQVAGPIGYFGPTATSSTPTLHPAGEIITMADDFAPSLYWLPIDAAANAATAREQARQFRKRGGDTNSSAWGNCLPHGIGATAETTDGGPPLENWPPTQEQQTQQAQRSWPLGRSRLARHNRQVDPMTDSIARRLYPRMNHSPNLPPPSPSQPSALAQRMYPNMKSRDAPPPPLPVRGRGVQIHTQRGCVDPKTGRIFYVDV
jgi:hypothetical protein